VYEQRAFRRHPAYFALEVGRVSRMVRICGHRTQFGTETGKMSPGIDSAILSIVR
jgi:hypothetical protein